MIHDTLQLPASAEAVPETAGRVAALGAEAGLDQQALFETRIAVTEALNNIIEHGIPGNRREPIEICCRVFGGDFEIRIRDRGIGFGKVPARADFPDPLAVHGRGWPLILGLIDDIAYLASDGCNELILVKRLA